MCVFSSQYSCSALWIFCMKTDCCCSPPPTLPWLCLKPCFPVPRQSLSGKANQDHFHACLLRKASPIGPHNHQRRLCVCVCSCCSVVDPRLATNNVDVFLSGNGMCVCVCHVSESPPQTHDCLGQRSNVRTEAFPLRDSFPLLPVSLFLVDRK